MNFVDRFTKTYQLELNKSPNEVLTSIELKIAEARKNNSWSFFEHIDYSLFKITLNTITISDEYAYSSHKLKGDITIFIDNSADNSIATVKVVPYGEYLQPCLLISGIFSLIFLLTMVGLVWIYPREIIYITLGWFICITTAYINFIIRRSVLADYPKQAFRDLGINYVEA